MRGHGDLVFMVEFIYVLLLDQFAETALVIVFISTVTSNISSTGCYHFLLGAIVLSVKKSHSWLGRSRCKWTGISTELWLFQFWSHYCHNQGFVQSTWNDMKSLLVATTKNLVEVQELFPSCSSTTLFWLLDRSSSNSLFHCSSLDCHKRKWSWKSSCIWSFEVFGWKRH